MDLDLPSWGRAALRLRHRNADAARAALEGAWAPTGDGLACLSVRSAFDCTLSALGWPAGTEVLVSAVNIKDMVTILRAHGLVPVPLPLDPETAMPAADAFEQAVTPRTRGFLFAHLFGAQADAAPLFEQARALGLFTFEDCAQAFQGTHWRGSADATYFSFGTIKTCTALGGALVPVADPTLLARMRAIESSWPTQRGYAKKVARALGFLALQSTAGYSLFSGVCRAFRKRPGDVVRTLSRGFGGLSDAALLRALRHRPCAALLRVMADRLARFDATTLASRRAWPARVAQVATVLGQAHARHAHWLLPVRVRDPQATQAALRAIGVDASGTSNIVSVGCPQTQALLAQVVMVPVYPDLPLNAQEQVLDVLRNGGT